MVLSNGNRRRYTQRMEHLDILTYIKSPLLDSALRDAVQSFLRSRDLPTEEKDLTSFLDKRPDGVAFDDDKKAICFLEFTRAMD